MDQHQKIDIKKTDLSGSPSPTNPLAQGVASQPHGPYTITDIALGPLSNTSRWDAVTQHNPAIQRDPVSGTYLLFYMGSTNNATPSTGGGPCATHPETNTLCMQRIGLATSASPYGPLVPVYNTLPHYICVPQVPSNSYSTTAYPRIAIRVHTLLPMRFA